MRSPSTRRAAFVLSLVLLLFVSSACALTCPQEPARPPEACHDAGGGEPDRAATEACCRAPSSVPVASESGAISLTFVVLAPLDRHLPVPSSRAAPPGIRLHRGPDPNHLRTRVLLI